MTHCMFLAQVIGWYLFLTSLAMLMNQTYFKKVMHDFFGNAQLLTFSGAISIIIGLLIVLTHNIWVSDWPVLVTIIGWLTLLQGVARFFFPEHAVQFAKNLQAKLSFSLISWFWLLIGLYLVWAGHNCPHC